VGFDLSEVIDEFTVNVPVTRFAPTATVKGRLQEPTPETTFRMAACIQPMTEKELQILPEGLRNQDAVKIYTTTKLRVVDQAQSLIPDRFDYEGATYQVALVDSWHDLGNFYRAVATRVTR
jgi:hypothetical protein